MTTWNETYIQELIPGCEVTHNSPDSLELWWNKCFAGARYVPRRNNWIASANDLLHDTMDTAPEVYCDVKNREDVLPKLKSLLEELLARREQGSGSSGRSGFA